jgi:hypothetical protein
MESENATNSLLASPPLSMIALENSLADSTFGEGNETSSSAGRAATVSLTGL